MSALADAKARFYARDLYLDELPFQNMLQTTCLTNPKIETKSRPTMFFFMCSSLQQLEVLWLLIPFSCFHRLDLPLIISSIKKNALEVLTVLRETCQCRLAASIEAPPNSGLGEDWVEDFRKSILFISISDLEA